MKLVRHVLSDQRGTKVYGSDPKNNILVKDLPRWLSWDETRLLIHEREMSMLMDTIQRYQKSSKDTDKKMIVSSINSLSKMIAVSAPHVVFFLMVVLFNINDLEIFEDFTLRLAPVEELIKRYTFLHLCIFNNRLTLHLQRVTDKLDQHMDLLRYNEEVLESVKEFFSGLLCEEKIEGYLASESSRSLIKKLLLVDTGFPLTIELDSEDLSTVAIDSAPKTASEEKNLIALSLSSLESAEQKNAEGFSVYRTSIEIDMQMGSRQGIAFFNFVRMFPDEDVKKIFKPLIYYKYYHMFWQMVFYALLDWTCAVLLYLYYGYHFAADWRIGLLAPVWIIISFKLLHEVCSMVADAKKYFSDTWNYFDLLLNTFSYFTSIYMHLHAGDSSSVRWLVAVRLLNMMMIIWRSVTWLRVFKPTRYLVTMILAVFSRMVSFLIILTIFIFAYAFLWRVTLSLNEPDGESEMSFYTSLLFATDIIFGNTANLTNDGQNVSVIQAIVHSLGNVVIALALLNFLIAIISGVYEEVNEDRELHDVKELMELISEFDSQAYGRSRILSRPLLLLRKLASCFMRLECCSRLFGNLSSCCVAKQQGQCFKHYILLPLRASDPFSAIEESIGGLSSRISNLKIEMDVLGETTRDQTVLLRQAIQFNEKFEDKLNLILNKLNK